MKGYKPYVIIIILSFFMLSVLNSCKGKGESAQKDDGIMEQTDQEAPLRSMLNADEMLELCTAPDAAALQLYMKEKTSLFFYAKKGEYISLAQGVVTDTSGQTLSLPMATLYFASEPGSTWRIAQTVHNDSLKNELLADFAKKEFALIDSVNYYATNAKAYRYQSAQYPGKLLYYSPTITHWYKKGIYLGANWISHVFELNNLGN